MTPSLPIIVRSDNVFRHQLFLNFAKFLFFFLFCFFFVSLVRDQILTGRVVEWCRLYTRMGCPHVILSQSIISWQSRSASKETRLIIPIKVVSGEKSMPMQMRDLYDSLNEVLPQPNVMTALPWDLFKKHFYQDVINSPMVGDMSTLYSRGDHSSNKILPFENLKHFVWFLT